MCPSGNKARALRWKRSHSRKRLGLCRLDLDGRQQRECSLSVSCDTVCRGPCAAGPGRNTGCANGAHAGKQTIGATLAAAGIRLLLGGAATPKVYANGPLMAQAYHAFEPNPQNPFWPAWGLATRAPAGGASSEASRGDAGIITVHDNCNVKEWLRHEDAQRSFLLQPAHHGLDGSKSSLGFFMFPPRHKIHSRYEVPKCPSFASLPCE